MKLSALILTAGVISSTATALSIIYDTDGSASRVTYYSDAAIAAMVTRSSSAYQLNIDTPHFSNPSPCSNAAVYLQNTDELITVLSVNYKTLQGTIPQGYEQQAKYVEANCTDEQGNSHTLRHKLAPAPKVTLTSQLRVDDWVEPSPFGPGYFDEVNYQGLLNIDNGEQDGYCVANTVIGKIPKLLSERHNLGFHSGVLSVQGQAKYDARAGVLVNEVICKSTGGTTRTVEVWHINELEQQREVTVEVF